MREVKKPSAIPVYGAGAVFCVLCLLLPVYRLWGLAVAVLACAAAFLVLRHFFPGKVIMEEIPEPEPDTGDEQLNELIRTGRESVQEIMRLAAAINDPKLSAQVQQIGSLCSQIFRAVEEQPSKQSQLRKFLNYYLPTTIKLLQSYERLAAQQSRGENITESLEGITRVMDSILEAFRKQLDSMFEFDALDISAEIAVMEQMLANEGLKVGDS